MNVVEPENEFYQIVITRSVKISKQTYNTFFSNELIWEQQKLQTCTFSKKIYLINRKPWCMQDRNQLIIPGEEQNGCNCILFGGGKIPVIYCCS